MFGLTYMKTVATLPSAIFFLASGAVTFALICLSFVRLPKVAHDTEEPVVASDEATVGEEQDPFVDPEVPTIIIVEDVNNKQPAIPRNSIRPLDNA